MSNPKDLAAVLIERVRALVPAGESATDYLVDLVDEALATSQPSDIPMGVVAGSSSTTSLASARRTAENLDDLARVCGRPEGVVDLGVLEWLMRPALPLIDGIFSPPAQGPWKHLSGEQARALATCVCRIDATIQGFDSFHLGTGFIVGRDRRERLALLTNAHVVEAAQRRFSWSKLKDVKLQADFAREIPSREAPAEHVPLMFDGDFSCHARYDLALLFTRPLEGEQRPFPKVSRSSPSSFQSNGIGVVGHPSFDSNIDPFPRLFGFGSQFGVKRFSPGFLRAVQVRSWRSQEIPVALHDATTLSGSSGSCIFNLESAVVCALHFGGWPTRRQAVDVGDTTVVAELFEANGAVPLWALAADPLLEDLSIEWV